LRDELLGGDSAEAQVVALLKDILEIIDFIHSYMLFTEISAYQHY